MQRKKTEEILRFLKGYKHVAEIAEEAMFIHSTKGVIFDVNASAESLTGYSRRELLKMNVRQLHPREDDLRGKKALDIINKSAVEVDFDTHIRKKDGKIIDVRIVGDKFRLLRRNFVIGVVRDISSTTKLAGMRKKIDYKSYKKFGKLVRRFRKGFPESILVLVDIAEHRDPFTMMHSLMVTDNATMLARSIGLPENEIETIQLACIFHDIGKIGIRARVLTKAGGLTPSEYREIKSHPLYSVEIVKCIKSNKGLISIIKHHHENYDGSGYPSGLKGGRIPLGARILSIADVYDALLSERAYRKAYSYRETLHIMKSEMSKKFDPVFLERFMECMFKQKQMTKAGDV